MDFEHVYEQDGEHPIDFAEEDEDEEGGGGGGGKKADDEDDQPFFWPGDHEEEEELGRKNEDDQLELNAEYHPVYEVWTLEGGPDASISAQTFNDRSVGKVKAFVRIVHDFKDDELLRDDELVNGPEDIFKKDWDDHYDVNSGALMAHMHVRVYVIAASNLQPMNKAIWYANGRSVANPFLQIRMIEDKNGVDHDYRSRRGIRFFDQTNPTPENYDTINPHFAQWTDLDGLLPGMADVEVKVCHKRLLSETEIGRTTVDIEDRWFSKQWREDMKEMRAPREYRSLYHPSVRLPRGKVEMWVEMYSEEKFREAQVANILPEKRLEWEVRVVIWDTWKIPKSGTRRTADIYVVGELAYFTEDGKPGPVVPQETDYHAGVRDGHATLNERFKFPVEIPAKRCRLKLAVYDHNLFSMDGEICACQVRGTAREAGGGRKG
eukprot:g4388.t1